MNKYLLNLLIFFCALPYLGNCQGDCIMKPLKHYLDTSQYILIFEASELIFDSTQIEFSDILGPKTRIARGRPTRIFKGNPNEISLCSAITVEWGYVFELGRKYLVFGRINENIFHVYQCSYSEPVKESKRFRRLYYFLDKYFLMEEYLDQTR